MPDLIEIRGDIATLRSLTDVPNLELIDETDKVIDELQMSVAAYADAIARAEIEARGCTTTLVKTEAELQAQIDAVNAEISDEPLDFGGNV